MEREGGGGGERAGGKVRNGRRMEAKKIISRSHPL